MHSNHDGPHFQYTVDMSKPEPAPVKNEHPALWPIVMADLIQEIAANRITVMSAVAVEVLDDMKQRHEFGLKKYGTPLQPFNGRDPLVDAYQEMLDACVYLRQWMQENKSNSTIIAQMYTGTLKQVCALRVVMVEFAKKRQTEGGKDGKA